MLRKPKLNLTVEYVEYVEKDSTGRIRVVFSVTNSGDGQADYCNIKIFAPKQDSLVSALLKVWDKDSPLQTWGYKYEYPIDYPVWPQVTTKFRLPGVEFTVSPTAFKKNRISYLYRLNHNKGMDEDSLKITIPK